MTEKDSTSSVGDVAPTYNPTGSVAFTMNVGRPYVADGQRRILLRRFVRVP